MVCLFSVVSITACHSKMCVLITLEQSTLFFKRKKKRKESENLLEVIGPRLLLYLCQELHPLIWRQLYSSPGFFFFLLDVRSVQARMMFKEAFPKMEFLCGLLTAG